MAGRGRSAGRSSCFVVGGEVLAGPIDARLVAAGTRDGALELVGDPQGRRAPGVLDHAGVGVDPVGQLLGGGRLGVGEAAGSEHGDEQLDAPQFPVCRSTSSGRLASVPASPRPPFGRPACGDQATGRAFTMTGFRVQLHRIRCSISRIRCSTSAGFGVQDPPDYAPASVPARDARRRRRWACPRRGACRPTGLPRTRPACGWRGPARGLRRERRGRWRRVRVRGVVRG